jgi:hypothetical protein
MKIAKLTKFICEEFISLPVSLGISREDMPQIPANKIEEFLSYLKEVGCDYERTTKKASELTPSQNELDTEKADKIWSDGKVDMPIIISLDRYVLDGHHRWFAAKRNDPNYELNCIMLSSNAKPALEIMHDFEGSHKRDIEGKLVEGLSADEESEIIKTNKKKTENQKPHDFQSAKWTHPNGHPRCIKCGQEESVSGRCSVLKVSEDYFTITDDMAISEIEKNWRSGNKGYDARKTLPSGEYYHGWYPTEEVWNLREYTRPVNPELLAAIKKDGIQSPIDITLAKKGKSYVGEGNHRLAVARELGIKKVPVLFSFYQEGKPDNFTPKKTRAEESPNWDTKYDSKGRRI